MQQEYSDRKTLTASNSLMQHTHFHFEYLNYVLPIILTDNTFICSGVFSQCGIFTAVTDVSTSYVSAVTRLKSDVGDGAAVKASAAPQAATLTKPQRLWGFLL